MKSILPHHLDLPQEAPVMVLPTPHFPNSLLPLHIFEPRYRAMLEWTLERQRMFCIALLKRGVLDWSGPEDFHHTAGLGLVRACVARPDGTSQLVLQGLARVSLTRIIQQEPFPLAEICELPSQPAEAMEAAALTAQLLELCARMKLHGDGVVPAITEQLAGVAEPDVLTDVIAHAFLQDPFRRQEVLEESSISERMRLVLRYLSAELE